MKNLIYIGPADGSNHKPLTVEGNATQTGILPGMAVERVANGFQRNATAATEHSHVPLIADKDQMRSRAVTAAWTQNENMVAIQPRSGEFFHVLVADGNNITAIDTPISVNNDGTFGIATVPGTVGATSEQVVAFSDEIINVTGANALVRVRVP